MTDWKEEIRRQLEPLKLSPTRENEIVEEMSQHLEDRYTALIAAGSTPQEASQVALAELGDSDALARLRRVEREVAGDPVVLGRHRSNSLDDLWHDLRYGLRMLRKHPGFTAVVVLTLALGIGVNTVFFTLFNLAFRPLPVRDPASIVTLECLGGLDRDGFSFPEYVYFRDHADVFSDLIASTWFHNLVLGDLASTEEQALVAGQFVSDNFFATLNANAVVGRPFTAGANDAFSRAPVVVLSYPFWQVRFGSDPTIIGRTLRLNGKQFVVMGVTEPDFVGLGLVRLRVPDIWLPLMSRVELLPEDSNLLSSRTLGWVTISGRLKPGRTREEAGSELSGLAAQLSREYPELSPATRVIARSTAMMGETPTGALVPMSVILSATFMVLLIACSNIANLLLARAAARQKEIGVRLCLGASRGRVIRQLLTESLLLALLGGAAGLLLAWWSLRAFLATALLSGAPAPPSVSTIIIHLNPDLRILGATFLLTLLAGVVFGLAPALRVTRAELIVALKAEAVSFGHQKRFGLRNGLIVAQVALSLVLLIAAGLLLHGVIRAGTIDSGLRTRNVLRLEPRIEAAGYDKARSQQFRDDLTARLEATPGVQFVSWVRRAPFRGIQPMTIALPATTGTPGRTIRAAYNAVTPNYFQTVGISIANGRGFTEDEMRAGAAVVLVTESTAKLLWPNQDPLGQYIRPGTETDFVQVIGVTRDAQTVSLGEADSPFIYLPLTPRRGPGELLVSTAGDANEMKPLVRAATQALDPNLFLQTYTLEEDIANQGRVVTARLAFKLAAGLGLLALLLAAIGLYSVMAYLVTQRTHEIGIRLALGAQPRQVRWLVLSQGMRVVGVGILLGIAGGAVVSRVLTSMLFGLSPFDPVAYIGVSIFLVAIAALAIYRPATRAARVDPMVALRYDG